MGIGDNSVGRKISYAKPNIKFSTGLHKCFLRITRSKAAERRPGSQHLGQLNGCNHGPTARGNRNAVGFEKSAGHIPDRYDAVRAADIANDALGTDIDFLRQLH